MVDITRGDIILCDLNPVMSTEQAVGGLYNDSVLLCEQIRVIDKSRIIRVLGHLDEKKMEQVDKALSTILGL
jgi:mRNA interferase MazF